MTIPQELRAARESAGLSQAQLASQIGKAPSTIYRWESGKVCPPADMYRLVLTVCREATGP